MNYLRQTLKSLLKQLVLNIYKRTFCLYKSAVYPDLGHEVSILNDNQTFDTSLLLEYDIKGSM